MKLADVNFVSIATTRTNNSVAAIAGKGWVTASAARREAGLSAEKIEVSGCVVPSGSRGGSCCAAAGGSCCPAAGGGCCPAAGGGCCPAAGGRPTLSRARLGPRRDLFSYGVPMRRITPGPAVPTGVRWVGEWVGGSPKDSDVKFTVSHAIRIQCWLHAAHPITATPAFAQSYPHPGASSFPTHGRFPAAHCENRTPDPEGAQSTAEAPEGKGRPGLLDSRWGYLNWCIRDKRRVIQWLVQSHQSLRRRLNNGEPYPFPDDSSEDTSTTSASTGHSSVLSSPSSTGSSAALQP